MVVRVVGRSGCVTEFAEIYDPIDCCVGQILLPPTKEEVNAFACVRLSLCLLARLLKNACMDLDEMLCVDRCRDMDELINV